MSEYHSLSSANEKLDYGTDEKTLRERLQYYADEASSQQFQKDKETRKKIDRKKEKQEAKRKEQEAKREEQEAKRKEEREAKREEQEAKRKEQEAKREKEREAKREEEQARRKIKTENQRAEFKNCLTKYFECIFSNLEDDARNGQYSKIIYSMNEYYSDCFNIAAGICPLIFDFRYFPFPLRCYTRLDSYDSIQSMFSHLEYEEIINIIKEVVEELKQDINIKYVKKSHKYYGEWQIEANWE